LQQAGIRLFDSETSGQGPPVIAVQFLPPSTSSLPMEIKLHIRPWESNRVMPAQRGWTTPDPDGPTTATAESE